MWELPLPLNPYRRPVCTLAWRSDILSERYARRKSTPGDLPDGHERLRSLGLGVVP
jgi:hypothetical protein